MGAVFYNRVAEDRQFKISYFFSNKFEPLLPTLLLPSRQQSKLVLAAGGDYIN